MSENRCPTVCLITPHLGGRGPPSFPPSGVVLDGPQPLSAVWSAYRFTQPSKPIYYASHYFDANQARRKIIWSRSGGKNNGCCGLSETSRAGSEAAGERVAANSAQACRSRETPPHLHVSGY